MRNRIAGLAMLGAGAAMADLPPLETGEVGGSEVRLYTLNFLTAEEVTVLRRFLGGSAMTLSQLLPVGGYGAVAVAPEEGYLSAGGLKERSVVGVGGMGSAEAADRAALAGCDALRRTVSRCIVILRVAPK